MPAATKALWRQRKKEESARRAAAAVAAAAAVNAETKVTRPWWMKPEGWGELSDKAQADWRRRSCAQRSKEQARPAPRVVPTLQKNQAGNEASYKGVARIPTTPDSPSRPWWVVAPSPPVSGPGEAV